MSPDAVASAVTCALGLSRTEPRTVSSCHGADAVRGHEETGVTRESAPGVARTRCLRAPRPPARDGDNDANAEARLGRSNRASAQSAPDGERAAGPPQPFGGKVEGAWQRPRVPWMFGRLPLLGTKN